jgi:peptidyl-prolyl cis-trans isomerase D
MFDLLRRAAQTWAAKLLMLLLVACLRRLGHFRTSHSSRGGSSSTTVVTVGDQQVDVNEFRLAYQRQVSNR